MPALLMNSPSPKDEGGPSAPHAPRAFARPVVAPPGLPWDQLKAAHLEARHGAPLPIAQLVYQLQRLERWSPGRPARFNVFYIRRDEVGAGVTAQAVVDGKPRQVVFVPAGERRRKAQLIAGGALLVALTILSLGGGVSRALELRRETASAADELELAAARRTRQIADRSALIRQMQAADQLRGSAAPIGAFLQDLAWASAAKVPGAHIEAIHWERGYLAAEVRGAREPFGSSGRQVVRSAKPLRPGVWLWGVAPLAGAGGRLDDQR